MNTHKINIVENIVGNLTLNMKKLFDTTKKPKIPYKDWTIQSNDTSLGKIDLSKIELYLDDDQKDGKYIEGNLLLGKLKGKPILNANVLDYLLKHKNLIPESWKDKYVYFWGTIYRDSFGNLCVRYLCWGGGSWNWGSRWLDGGWHSGSPAAMLASSKNLESLSFFDPLDFEIKYKGIAYKLEKK